MGLRWPTSKKEVYRHCIKGRKKTVQKKTQKIISKIPEDFTVPSKVGSNPYSYMML